MTQEKRTKNRENNILIWLLTSFAVASFLYRGILLPLFYPPYSSNDFRGVFYPQVKTFLSEGNLYRDSFAYYYPPFSVFLIGPLTSLTVALAEKVWFFILLISLFSSFFLLVKSFSNRGPLLWALMFFALSQFEPIYVDLSYYQIDLIILLTLVVAYRLELKGLSFLAGVVLSVGSLIKITPIFFLFYFLVLKKWKSILGFLGGLLFFGALTLPFLGAKSWSDFFLYGIPHLLEESPGNRLDQSFTNLLLDIQEGLGATGKLQKSAPWIRTGSIGFALAVLAALGHSLKRRKGTALGLEYAAVICGMLLSSNMMRETHLVLLFFPFLVILSFLFQDPKSNPRLIILVSIAFTVVALHYGYTAPFLKETLWGLLLAKAKFFGTVLTYLCCLFLLRENKNY